MGDEQGADGSRVELTLQDVLADFRMLKESEGLTPEKMGEARAVLNAIGEVHPTRATQKLLDDLADLSGPDGIALQWALRTHPDSHLGQTLDARRARSGVVKSTAKDRERRAVEKLFSKWMVPRADWASAVYVSVFTTLPATTNIRLGSMEVWVSVHHDASRDLPVIELRTENRVVVHDFLTVAANANQAMVVYGTAELSWRLQIMLPPYERDTVLVFRSDSQGAPQKVLVERTEASGVSISQEIPGPLSQDLLIGLPTSSLDPPCPISWWWVVPPDESSPAIDRRSD